MDFTDLNKACPKDSYPLPSIDALVDSASGGKLLSFLDAFSGYNQIRMHPRDECKMILLKTRAWRNCLVARLTRLWQLCYLQEHS